MDKAPNVDPDLNDPTNFRLTRLTRSNEINDYVIPVKFVKEKQ